MIWAFTAFSHGLLAVDSFAILLLFRAFLRKQDPRRRRVLVFEAEDIKYEKVRTTLLQLTMRVTGGAMIRRKGIRDIDWLLLTRQTARKIATTVTKPELILCFEAFPVEGTRRLSAAPRHSVACRGTRCCPR